jgi:uncharacterized membrane protein HdeD (DUF308 family)
MIKTLINNWWLFALRSVLAAVFSIMAFMMQSSAGSFTLREFATKGMVAFLGILALAAGLCTIGGGIWRSRDQKSWLVVLDGVGVSAAGLVLIVSNSIAIGTVMHLLAFLAMAIGFAQVAAARMLRRHIPDEWFLVLAGVASAGCGFALLVISLDQPGSIFGWLGGYSAFSAVCMMGLALRLRNLRSSIHRLATGTSHN